jgi:hypothetical protein
MNYGWMDDDILMEIFDILKAYSHLLEFPIISRHGLCGVRYPLYIFLLLLLLLLTYTLESSAY